MKHFYTMNIIGGILYWQNRSLKATLKKIFFNALLIPLFLFVINPNTANAQATCTNACDNPVPCYSADLSGSIDASVQLFISGAAPCCTSTPANNNCTEISLLLNPDSEGIEVTFFDGPNQCSIELSDAAGGCPIGPSQGICETFCPTLINNMATFVLCKPGSFNQIGFEFTAVPRPQLSAESGCNANILVLPETTNGNLTWSADPPEALGYLSCPSGLIDCTMPDFTYTGPALDCDGATITYTVQIPPTACTPDPTMASTTFTYFPEPSGTINVNCTGTAAALEFIPDLDCPEITYQWLDPNGAIIPGQTGTALTIDPFDDMIYCINMTRPNCEVIQECAVATCCLFEATCTLDSAPQTIEGCTIADVPAPFTDFNDVFTNINECSTTILLVDDVTTGSLCGTTPLQVTRTYTIVDDFTMNGDYDLGEPFFTCEQNFIIVDTNAPMVPTPPMDVNVQCGGDIPAPVSLTAMDNCDGAITVMPTDQTVSGACVNAFTVTRTWTFTDICGNTSEVSQLITIGDSTAPMLPTPPMDFNGQCGGDIPTAVELTAMDNCDGAITVMPTDETIPGACPSSFTVIRTWSFTDACGNTSEVSQNINIGDTTVPMLPTPPVDVNEQCSGDIPAPVSLTAMDNCDGAITVMPTDETFPGACINAFTVIRTWTFTDACGNTSDVSQTITIGDTTAPELPTPPADVDAQCGAEVPVAISLTTTDNCDGSIAVMPTEETMPGACANSYMLVRTWTFIDICGNESSVSQNIMVGDMTAPVPPIPPTDFDAQCGGEVPVAISLTATDNCDGMITVMPTEETTPGACANSYMLVRTWTFTDACGNESSVSQNIMVGDMTAPVVPTAPADVFGECGGEVPAPIDLTAVDNCDGNITVSPVDVTDQGACSKSFVVTRTWTFTDACGNSSSVSQVISIGDMTAPALPTPPADEVGQCGGDIPAPVNLTAIDNCNGDITVSPIDEITPGACPSSFVVTRTWTFMDACGNTSAVSQLITIGDTTPPTLPIPPADATGQCNEDIPVAVDLTAIDNCDGNITVSPVDDVAQGACPSSFVITRTWTFTDACGNTSSVSQLITINDTTVPSTPNPPMDLNVQCGADIPTAESLTAVDNCDGNVTVFPTEETIQGNCPNSFILTRTWTFVDACGNESSVAQNINVNDDTAPALPTPPVDVVIQCGADIPAPVDLTAIDNCDGAITVSPIDESLAGSCSGQFSITRTWTFVDACGNESSVSQNININDDTAPTLPTAPADVTFECADEVPAQIDLTATDNCGTTITVSPTDDIVAGACPNSFVVTRTWSFADDCDNAANVQQIITIEDTTAPDVVCQDIEIELSANGTASITTTMIDNGTTDNCGVFSLALDVTDFDCTNVGANTVTLSATDDCGNISTCTATVTVLDNIGPALTCPSDIEVNTEAGLCQAGVNWFHAALQDNCGGASLEVAYEGIGTPPPTSVPTGGPVTESGTVVETFQGGTTMVTYTATDASGNTSTCSFTVHVQDDQAPSITCPQNIVVNLGPGACDAIVEFDDPVVEDNCDVTISNLDQLGLASGDPFPIGVNTIIYQVEDIGGNVATCSFDVTIIEFADVAENVTCNDGINISLDENCEYLVGADVILEGGPYGCYDDYIVEVLEDAGYDSPAIPSSPTITGDYIGQTLTVTVTDPETGDYCWGRITVEDKMAPIIECEELTISCTVAEDLSPDNPAIGYPNVIENCDEYELSYTDSTEEFECTGDNFLTVTRTWLAIDNQNNSSTCVQLINVARPSLDDVVFPLDLDNVEAPALNCTNANTDPSSTGQPLVDGNPIPTICQLGITYSDETLIICSGSYKIIREWIAIDWCTNTVLRHNQIIKVLDTSIAIECPIYEDLTTSPYECTAQVYLEAPTVNDPCSDTYSVEVEGPTGQIISLDANGGYYPDELEVGTHEFTYTVTDDCGNTTSCTTTITIFDGYPPTVICDAHTEVAVGSDGTARVHASTFDDGSADNCGDVYFKVRRMDIGGCDGLNGDDSAAADYQEWFDDYVSYCCEDIAESPTMVIFRVYDIDPGSGPVDESRHEEGGDLYNHFNDCMVEVVVEDKLSPTIVCPADITVSCHFSYDMDNLAATFGTVVTNATDQSEIITVDPDGLGTTNWGLDGLAYDNCDLTISENSNANIECGNGLITRVFTVTDPSGLTSSCVQRIRVTNFDPFNESDINWPQEVVERDCTVGIDADSVPGPTVDADQCDHVFIGHEDLILPIDEPYCFKIVRTWVVIDWCQYVPNSAGSIGRWEFNQVIKVTDNQAPEFISCTSPDTGCSYDEDCGPGYITLTAEATDECSLENLTYYYEIDAFNDGTADIQGAGNDASGDYPIGVHSITFYATDGCGNVSECSYTFEIEDCKAPTPVCQVIATAVMPSTGAIEIWASDFEAGSSFDNCTTYEDLRFRIRKVNQFDAPNNTVPSASSTSVTFDCNELGQQWVDLWVGDELNNWDHCRTYVTIQDPNGACGNTEPTGSIAGRIANEDNEEIADVIVDISGANAYNPFTTTENGSYTFDNIPMNANYTVTPEKDINPLNGVSTYDLVLIQKHILGVENLDSPYKLIAADVNKSDNITTFDLVKLRRLILHIDTEFDNNTSWRFVDKDFVFPNPTNPFTTSFPEVISYNDLTASELNADFVGVKIGDVNGSALVNNFTSSDRRSTSGQLLFNVADQLLKAGQSYEIEFVANDAVQGYQFTLGFDQKALAFENLAKADEDNFGLSLLSKGVITTSWNSTKAEQQSFSINFRAKKDVQLSEVLKLNSSYTIAEAYSETNDLLDVSLSFNANGESTIVGGEFELYQNRPNPFTSTTQISFTLPEASTATLTIFDVSGKVVKQYTSSFEKGFSTIEINREDLSSIGVLYYRLDTNKYTGTKKMIFVK